MIGGALLHPPALRVLPGPAARESELLPIVSAADLHEQVAAELEFLIEGLVPAGTCGVIGGPAKGRKTWLAASLALSLTLGRPFLGFRVPYQRVVLYVAAEGSLWGLGQRIDALAAALGVTRHQARGLILSRSPRLFLNERLDLDRLHRTVLSVRPDLVVLDPLVRLHSLDENLTRDMARLLGDLRELQRDAATTLLICHHYGHAKDGRAGHNALRGSSDIPAWLDYGIFVSWKDQARRHGGLAFLHRDIESPEPMDVEFTLSEGRAQFRVLGTSTGPGESTRADRIRAALREHPTGLAKTPLATKAKVSPKVIDAELQALGPEVDSHGVKDAKGRRQTVFVLAPAAGEGHLRNGGRAVDCSGASSIVQSTADGNDRRTVDGSCDGSDE